MSLHSHTPRPQNGTTCKCVCVNDHVYELIHSRLFTTTHVRSDPRHDMEMKFMHNILYELRELRRADEMQKRKEKGLQRLIGVSRTKASIPMCVVAGRQACTMMKKYSQELMDSLDLPSSRQLRESKEYRLRSIEARKSRRAVELNRIRRSKAKALTDVEKASFIDNAVIETDKIFREKELAAEYRATVDGKIEGALDDIIQMPMWTALSSSRYRYLLDQYHPAFTSRVRQLWNDPSTRTSYDLWTKSGLINPSKVNKGGRGSNKQKGGLRIYLESLHNIAELATADAVESKERARASQLGQHRDDKAWEMPWAVSADHRWSRPVLMRVLSFMGDGEGVRCKHPATLLFLCATSKRFCLLATQIINTGDGTAVVDQPVRKDFVEVNDIFPIDGNSRVTVVSGSLHLAVYTNQGRNGPEVELSGMNGTQHTAVWKDCTTEGMQAGDRIVVEVSNTTGGINNLQVRTSRSLEFYDQSSVVDTTTLSIFGVMIPQRKVCVLTIDNLLGFEDKDRARFVVRPYAREFLRRLSRDFILCVWSSDPGRAIFCNLLFEYPLLFVYENPDKPVVGQISDVCGDCASWVDCTNCLLIDTISRGGDHTNTILIPTYERRKKRDSGLSDSDLWSTMSEIVNCVDIGVFLSEYNE